ncbi:MAG: hypothetical protein IPG50_20635 [Myxococcales bacterium]|nr:hypothetical protein [Myxococcales bacterium]
MDGGGGFGGHAARGCQAFLLFDEAPAGSAPGPRTPQREQVSDGPVSGVTGLADGATPAADAGYCATFGASVRLCDDFDGVALGTRWTSENRVGNVKLLIGDGGRSAPRALRVETAASNGADPAAQLLHRAAGRPKSARVSFALLVESVPSNEHPLVVLPVETSTGEFRAELLLSGGTQLRLNETNVVFHGPAGAIQAGQWAQVELNVTFSGAPHGTVKLNGATIIDTPLTVSALTGNQVALDFGLYRGGPAAVPSKVLFDDLLYDYVLE